MGHGVDLAFVDLQPLWREASGSAGNGWVGLCPYEVNDRVLCGRGSTCRSEGSWELSEKLAERTFRHQKSDEGLRGDSACPREELASASVKQTSPLAVWEKLERRRKSASMMGIARLAMTSCHTNSESRNLD